MSSFWVFTCLSNKVWCHTGDLCPESHHGDEEMEANGNTSRPAGHPEGGDEELRTLPFLRRRETAVYLLSKEREPCSVQNWKGPWVPTLPYILEGQSAVPRTRRTQGSASFKAERRPLDRSWVPFEVQPARTVLQPLWRFRA